MTPAPRWKGVTAQAIEGRHIESLSSGKIAFLRIPGFLEKKWCDEVLQRFLAAGPREIYREHKNGFIRTRELGLMYTHCDADPRRYHAEAPRLNESLRRVYAGGEDPLLKLRQAMAQATGWGLLDPTGPQRPLSTDLIRAASAGTSSPIHTDAYGAKPLPFPMAIDRIWSWNVYLSMSEGGGELALYKRYPRPADSAHYLPGCRWAYLPAVVKGAPSARCLPSQGDLVIFDAGKYHEVRMTQGAGYRASAHSYLGLNAREKKLVFWV